MRLRQPEQLDLRRILEAAHKARHTHPELWEKRLLGALGAEDGWHQPPIRDEDWRWHASSLSKCPRALVLQRAGLATDGVRPESQATFDIGSLYHALIETGMEVLPEYEVLAIEVGGRTTLLAARADCVYRTAGGPVTLIDVKTESSFAGKHRREEAPTAATTAKLAHQVQLKATEMVLAKVSPEIPPITAGWIVYVDKESGALDQQPVDLTQTMLRQRVLTTLRTLEDAWAAYVRDGTLPPLLPDENKRRRDGMPYTVPNWECRPRGDDDPRGMYCLARSRCMELA